MRQIRGQAHPTHPGRRKAQTLLGVKAMLNLNKQINLKDGRKLGYVECGDTQGRPPLLFHYSPCSRLAIGRQCPVAEELDARSSDKCAHTYRRSTSSGLLS
jgi:hypothetical protein